MIVRQNSRNHEQQPRLGAILTMELVLVLPIFLIIICGLIEFIMISAAQSRMDQAAHAGLRMMSVSGADQKTCRQQIENLLGPRLALNYQLDMNPAEYPGEIGELALRIPMQNACPDMLWMFGFGLQGRQMQSSAAMVMERVSSRTDDADVPWN